MLFDTAISAKTQALRRSVWFMEDGCVTVTSPDAFCLQPIQAQPVTGGLGRPSGLLWVRLPGPVVPDGPLVTFIAAASRGGLDRERERLELFLGADWKAVPLVVPLPAVSALIQGRVEMDDSGLVAGEWQGLGSTKRAG